MVKLNMAGERNTVDKVVDGGQSVDFKEILVGFTKGDCSNGTDDVEDEGESDKSLLLLSESIWNGRS